MSNKCQGLFGLLFGHKYQGRFDRLTTEQLPSNSFQLHGTMMPEKIKAMKSRSETIRYHRDICVRCGAILEK